MCLGERSNGSLSSEFIFLRDYKLRQTFMPYKSATFLFPKLLVNFKVTTFLPIRAIIARIIFLHIQWEFFLMND